LNLGVFFRDQEKDGKQALKWLYAAAEQDEGQAFYELAKMFRQGISVDPDPAQALVWIFLAKRKDYETGELEKGLKEELTPAQHEMADRMIREYIKKLEQRTKESN
jgi:TPR repeat protein